MFLTPNKSHRGVYSSTFPPRHGGGSFSIFLEVGKLFKFGEPLGEGKWKWGKGREKKGKGKRRERKGEEEKGKGKIREIIPFPHFLPFEKLPHACFFPYPSPPQQGKDGVGNRVPFPFFHEGKGK